MARKYKVTVKRKMGCGCGPYCVLGLMLVGLIAALIVK